MACSRSARWRRLLPWAVSAATLGYVFGFAVDWRQLIAATEGANLPLFLAYATADKLIFFLWWGALQAAAVRRFVTPVSTRQVIAVRGGAELLRTVNGALADAGLLYGLAQLAHGRLAAVMAAALIPFTCHFFVLTLQASLSLFAIEGGVSGNRDILVASGVGWTMIGSAAISMRTGLWKRFEASRRFGSWLRKLELRALSPFLLWFALFAAFDVLIQGLASRAFGVVIDWWALAGRIPILYLAMSFPSFGNFGTREVAWAACFADFGSRETLIAYALATNTVFLVLHAAIGVLFLPHAVALVAAMRRARREGDPIPTPLLHDPSDP